MRLIQNKKPFKHVFLKILRITVSVGLMAFLVSELDIADAYQIVLNSEWLLLIVGLLIHLMKIPIVALRSKITLETVAKVNYKYLEAILTYLYISPFNVLLPSIIGGDAIRLKLQKNYTGVSIIISAFSIFIERITGLLFIFLLASITIPASALKFDIDKRWILLLPFFAVFGYLVFSVAYWKKKSIISLYLSKVVKAFSRLSWSTSLKIFLLSVFFQLTDMICSYCIARGLNVGISFFEILSIFPVVYVVTILPISIGGIGVRESILVFLLGFYGVTSEIAITFSFIIYLNKIVGSLIMFSSYHILKYKCQEKFKDYKH